MRIKVLISIAAVAVVIFASCEKNSVTSEKPSGCVTSNITYGNSIQGIIAYDCAYTTSCHAAGTKYPDFSTYAVLKQYADNGQLYEQLFVSRRMPPPPQPLIDDCSLAQIKAWIDSGTPQ